MDPRYIRNPAKQIIATLPMMFPFLGFFILAPFNAVYEAPFSNGGG
jgi:hypothetical protein